MAQFLRNEKDIEQELILESEWRSNLI